MKEGKSKWMSGSKWKLVGEGSSGRHLTGKRHSHRIQPRSFLSLPLLASPLSSFFLRHLLRWRVATRPFYLDNLQAREVSSLATLWMNEWTKKMKKKNCLLNIFKNLINHCATYLLATIYLPYFFLQKLPKFFFPCFIFKNHLKIFVKLKFF